jgi:hypothetical protein
VTTRATCSVLATLAAAIARSQIVVSAPPAPPARRVRLPDGFDEIDLAILDWIAAEGRRTARRLVRM